MDLTMNNLLSDNSDLKSVKAMKDLEQAKMNEKIVGIIKQLEAKHQIKCLYVCESGSRMWGFHSDVYENGALNLDKSSDYDVRGIFSYTSTDTYLGIKPYKEQIEHFEYTENGTLTIDIVLWDIRKAAKLALSTNSSLYEWIMSDITYYPVNTDESLLENLTNEKYIIKWMELNSTNFFRDFSALFLEYMNNMTLRNHYVGQIKSNYQKYIAGNNEVSCKKYLYILRSLACVYALDHNEIPEMNYKDVYEYLPLELQDIMDELVEVKKAGEKTMVPYKKEIYDATQGKLDFSTVYVDCCMQTEFKDKMNALVVKFISLS